MLLRRFSTVMYLISLIPIYFFVCFSIGLALTPGFFIFQKVINLNIESDFVRFLSYGVTAAFSYILYGLSLVFILPAIVFILRLYPSEGRRATYSFESFKWYFYNGLVYIMRYTFLELITPSPMNNLFYKLMGMKFGKNVYNNTSAISDPCLIEVGDNVTIGGTATIIAHYSQKGVMIITPVKIGSKVTIGLRAIIFGGVQIGDGCTIMPNSVVLPKTIIPAGETWGGVPAQKLR